MNICWRGSFITVLLCENKAKREKMPSPDTSMKVLFRTTSKKPTAQVVAILSVIIAVNRSSTNGFRQRCGLKKCLMRNVMVHSTIKGRLQGVWYNYLEHLTGNCSVVLFHNPMQFSINLHKLLHKFLSESCSKVQLRTSLRMYYRSFMGAKLFMHWIQRIVHILSSCAASLSLWTKKKLLSSLNLRNTVGTNENEKSTNVNISD